MALRYQKKKARAPVGGLEKKLGRKPSYKEMEQELYGPDKSGNTLLKESAEQIRRHEELTGINQEQWDLILKQRVMSHNIIMETRNAD